VREEEKEEEEEVWTWKEHNSLTFYTASSKKLNVSKYPVCKLEKKLKKQKKKI
jgi:hypothetical protein